MIGLAISKQTKHYPDGRFYSIEFQIQEPQLRYQFKLWNSEGNSMFVLVKEDSVILSNLEVGNTFKGKYYCEDRLHSIELHDTQINHIIRDESGRFKGHFLVGLSILNPPTPQLPN